MPRVSRAQAAQNRELIEATSSRLMREQGIHGVSVADLMQAAGLTHGGFYGHFESKDALAAEVCDKAFAESLERWQTRVARAGSATAGRDAIVAAYLRSAHRDQPGSGCPTVALAVDVAREPADKPVHAAYVAGIQAQIEALSALAPGLDPDADRREALLLLATLVGAQALARATRGDGISEEFLAAARTALLPAAEGDVSSGPTVIAPTLTPPKTATRRPRTGR